MLRYFYTENKELRKEKLRVLKTWENNSKYNYERNSNSKGFVYKFEYEND